MKHRHGPVAGALGCVALLLVACGGSSFEGVEGSAGNASGGDGIAGGSGKSSGGSATAGTSNGGASNGGASNGGASNGGSNHGGSNRGGTSNGGSASGGVSSGGVTSGGVSSAGNATGGTTIGGSGGDPLACNEDADCAACLYPTAPKSALDCYCPGCGDTALSKSACTANQTAFEKQCSKTPIVCPAIACVEPPLPQCKSHTCVVTRQ